MEWARLGVQLDPTNDEAKALVVAWSEALAPTPAVPALAASAVPPLAGVGPAAATQAGPGGARVAIDVSNAKPGVGQPVDFTARLLGARGHLDAASFRFAGPGLGAGTDVPAADDGTGLLRTTFTFLQPGRFDVSFTARAGSAPATTVRGARSLLVGVGAGAAGDAVARPGAASAPPVPATPAPATPAPSASAQKWL
jgi:hypothetical protein